MRENFDPRKNWKFQIHCKDFLFAMIHSVKNDAA